MNISKIASIANVSISTVSKAFSNSNEISEATKERIFAIAKENNCFDKYIKRQYEKRVVGIITPEIDSAFYCPIVTYLEKELNRQGFTSIISLSNFSEKKEAELLSYFTSRNNADGVFIIQASSNVKYNKDIPIVLINYSSINADVDCIKVDFSKAIDEAVQLFKQNGHKKIGFIGDTLTSGKKDLFVQSLKKHNLTINYNFITEECNRFENAGYSGMEKFYSLENRPTAIFCAYDNIALGAIQCINAHGNKVPDDFSIIGTDNISFASNMNVSLTTITPNTKELCDIALNILINKMKSPGFSLRQTINLRSELIVRKSVKDISEKTSDVSD